jgi:hypothetical protein
MPEPSFFRTFLKMVGQLLLLLIPIFLYAGLLAWLLLPHHPLVYIWVLSCTLTLAMVGYTAWTQYRWNKRDWVRGDSSKKKGSGHVTPASMPIDYLEPGKRKLHEIPPGESAWINFTDVAVDLAGKTYVDLGARVYTGPNFSTVRVFVQENGCYRLAIPNKATPFTFTPRRLHFFESYAPVTEVVAEDDPIDPLRHS